MPLAQNLRPTVYKLRALAGKLGFRPFTVQLIHRNYTAPDADYPFTGGFSGNAPNETVIANITEADGYAPRVVFRDSKVFSKGAPIDAELQIGPMTPLHSGNGTDIDDLLAVAVEDDADTYLLISGDGFDDDGSRFAIISINTQSPLGYMVFAKRISGKGT